MTPDDGYAEAWTLLNAEYGDTYKISMAYLKMVMEWNPIPHDDSAALKHFSFFLIKCLHAMRSVSHMVVLNHPPNMQTVVLKLPTYLQHKWRDQVIRLKQQEQQRPQFSDIVSFVRNAAESANDPIYGKDALSKYDDASIMSKPLRHTSIQKSSRFAVSVNHKTAACHATGTNQTTDNVQDRLSVETMHNCQLCRLSHDLEDCPTYSHKSVDDRRVFLQENRLCYGCLRYGHISKRCTSKRICETCHRA